MHIHPPIYVFQVSGFIVNHWNYDFAVSVTIPITTATETTLVYQYLLADKSPDLHYSKYTLSDTSLV